MSLTEEKLAQLRQVLADCRAAISPHVPAADPPETTDQAFLQILAARLDLWVGELDGTAVISDRPMRTCAHCGQAAAPMASSETRCGAVCHDQDCLAAHARTCPECRDDACESVGSPQMPVVLSNLFWDCECAEKFIKPWFQETCPNCRARQKDQPDSRVDEVLAHAADLSDELVEDVRCLVFRSAHQGALIERAKALLYDPADHGLEITWAAVLDELLDWLAGQKIEPETLSDGDLADLLDCAADTLEELDWPRQLEYAWDDQLLVLKGDHCPPTPAPDAHLEQDYEDRVSGGERE